MPKRGAHRRAAPPAYSDTRTMVTKAVQATSGRLNDAGSTPGGTSPSMFIVMGNRLTAISMITVPPTVGVISRRKNDSRAENRNCTSDETTTRARQQRQAARRHRCRRHADERARRAHVEGIAGPERSHRPGLKDGGQTADHEGREHRPLQPLGVARSVEDDDGNEDDAGQDDGGDLQAEAEGQPFRGRFVDGIAQARIRRRPSSRVAHETTPFSGRTRQTVRR